MKQINVYTGHCAVGVFAVGLSDKGICCLTLGDTNEQALQAVKKCFPSANLIKAQDSSITKIVANYIDNPKDKLSIDLDIQGTDFQKTVWEKLAQVPYGTTTNYTELAEKIGNPKAVRAVARACALNKIVIAIPCHRVLRLDGGFSGYRYGVQRKIELLKREGININTN